MSTSQPVVISITAHRVNPRICFAPRRRGQMAAQTKLRRSFWQRIGRVLIQDVPPQEGLCEFDCPHLKCSEARWQACENRLRDVSVNSQPLTRWAQAKPGVEWGTRLAGIVGAGLVLLLLVSAAYSAFVYLL